MLARKNVPRTLATSGRPYKKILTFPCILPRINNVALLLFMRKNIKYEAIKLKADPLGEAY